MSSLERTHCPPWKRHSVHNTHSPPWNTQNVLLGNGTLSCVETTHCPVCERQFDMDTTNCPLWTRHLVLCGNHTLSCVEITHFPALAEITFSIMLISELISGGHIETAQSLPLQPVRASRLVRIRSAGAMQDAMASPVQGLSVATPACHSSRPCCPAMLRAWAGPKCLA